MSRHSISIDLHSHPYFCLRVEFTPARFRANFYCAQLFGPRRKKKFAFYRLEFECSQNACLCRARHNFESLPYPNYWEWHHQRKLLPSRIRSGTIATVLRRSLVSLCENAPFATKVAWFSSNDWLPSPCNQHLLIHHEIITT